MQTFVNSEPYPLVVVTWLDAVAANGWKSLDDHGSLSVVTTIGWKIHDTPDMVLLAGTIAWLDGQSEMNQMMLLPRGMIVEERELTPGSDNPRGAH